MEALVFVAVWIVCGFVGSIIASAKGAPTYKGFLWGFLIGPIGWIIAALILAPDKDPKAERAAKIEKARALARQQNASKPSLGVADELAKLAELKSRGALTEDEFAEQKRKILAR